MDNNERWIVLMNVIEMCAKARMKEDEAAATIGLAAIRMFHQQRGECEHRNTSHEESGSCETEYVTCKDCGKGWRVELPQ